LDPWNDSKIRQLFLPSNSNEHAKDAIARRIDLLMEARTEPEGYKRIVLGGDLHNNCTDYDILKLSNQSMYLISALTIALEEYPRKTWRQCCQEASNTCSKLTASFSGRTVEDWWRSFRQNNGFPHPRGMDGNSMTYKQRLPPLLRDHEDLRRKFLKFCATNLSDLSVERVQEFVRDDLLPTFIPLTNEMSVDDRKHLLEGLYGLSDNPSRSTIWRWLKGCGFKYKLRTKRFFVDTHESPANRRYRKDQTARYLKRERRMHRWFQFTVIQAQEYENEGLLIPGRGFRYTSELGESMVELHVDEIPNNKLLTIINATCKFGGKLSVRMAPEEKPLLSFGHDECIFRQFIFTGYS
jgi:hypothetical protein